MTLLDIIAKYTLLALILKWVANKRKAWRSKRLRRRQREQRAYLYVHSAKLLVQLEAVTYHWEATAHKMNGRQLKKHFKRQHSLQWQLTETNKLLMKLMHELDDEFSRVHINIERWRKEAATAEARLPPWLPLTPPPHEPTWLERFSGWLGTWWRSNEPTLH
jgi:hypothetical protein